MDIGIIIVIGVMVALCIAGAFILIRDAQQARKERHTSEGRPHAQQDQPEEPESTPEEEEEAWVPRTRARSFRDEEVSEPPKPSTLAMPSDHLAIETTDNILPFDLTPTFHVTIEGGNILQDEKPYTTATCPKGTALRIQAHEAPPGQRFYGWTAVGEIPRELCDGINLPEMVVTIEGDVILMAKWEPTSPPKTEEETAPFEEVSIPPDEDVDPIKSFLPDRGVSLDPEEAPTLEPEQEFVLAPKEEPREPAVEQSEGETEAPHVDTSAKKTLPRRAGIPTRRLGGENKS